MLITYNQNSDRGSQPKFDKKTESDPITTSIATLPVTPLPEQTLIKPPKKRFQNIRNGLTKSNRKLPKPDTNFINSGNNNSCDVQDTSSKSTHLQLIVSKCRCEFYMIDFEDKIGDDEEHVSHVSQVKSNNLMTSSSLSTSPTLQINIQTPNETKLNNNSLNYSQIVSNLNNATKNNGNRDRYNCICKIIIKAAEIFTY